MAVISTGGNGAAIAQIFQALIEAEDRKKRRAYEEALKQQALAQAGKDKAATDFQSSHTNALEQHWNMIQNAPDRTIQEQVPYFTGNISDMFGEMPVDVPNPERQRWEDQYALQSEALMHGYKGTDYSNLDALGTLRAMGNWSPTPSEVLAESGKNARQESVNATNVAMNDARIAARQRYLDGLVDLNKAKEELTNRTPGGRGVGGGAAGYATQMTTRRSQLDTASKALAAKQKRRSEIETLHTSGDSKGRRMDDISFYRTMRIEKLTDRDIAAQEEKVANLEGAVNSLFANMPGWIIDNINSGQFDKTTEQAIEQPDAAGDVVASTIDGPDSDSAADVETEQQAQAKAKEIKATQGAAAAQAYYEDWLNRRKK